MSGPTALYVEVPVAADLVRDAAGSPRRLMHREPPAHVTVLWPFMPRDALDAPTMQAVADVIASFPVFTAHLGTVGAFDDLVYLAPDDPEPFIAMTDAIAARWPAFPPYGGEFATVVPHLTLGNGERAQRVAREASLPIVAEVGEVSLAFEHRWFGWRTVRRFRLG